MRAWRDSWIIPLPFGGTNRDFWYTAIGQFRVQLIVLLCDFTNLHKAPMDLPLCGWIAGIKVMRYATVPKLLAFSSPRAFTSFRQNIVTLQKHTTACSNVVLSYCWFVDAHILDAAPYKRCATKAGSTCVPATRQRRTEPLLWNYCGYVLKSKENGSDLPSLIIFQHNDCKTYMVVICFNQAKNLPNKLCENQFDNWFP